MIQCPTCGTHQVHSGALSSCESCGALLTDTVTVTASPTPAVGIPWENTERENIFKALFNTIWESMMHPSRFFSHITKTSSLFHALLFGLTAGSIGVLFDLSWQNSFTDFWEILALQGIDIDFSQPISTSLVFSPLLLILHIVLLSLFIHFLLVVTRGSHNTFRSTVITVCYIQSAAVLSFIPVFGNVISPIWALVILIIGISSVHNISKTRSGLTLLFPFIFLALFTLFVLLAALFGTIIMSTFLKEILPFFR